MGRYKMPYTLYKRGKYWYYRTYDNNGLRGVAHTTGQSSKVAARAFCEGLYLSGKINNSQVIFKEYSKGFYDKNSIYVKDRVRPLAANTLKNFRSQFDNTVKPYFDNIKLCDIDYKLIKKFRAELVAQGRASNSVKLIMLTLRNVITFAYKEGLISKNPFENLEALQSNEVARDSFTLEEVKGLYNYLEDSLKNFLLLLALTGLRMREAVGVLPADIIKDNGLIYINLTKQMQGGVYVPLKNNKPRAVPVTAQLAELVPALSYDGLNLFYIRVKAFVRSNPALAGRKLSVHSLRHFFITSAKSAGINAAKVEVIAGHSLKGIEKVYTNFKPWDLTDIYVWQELTLKAITQG